MFTRWTIARGGDLGPNVCAHLGVYFQHPARGLTQSSKRFGGRNYNHDPRQHAPQAETVIGQGMHRVISTTHQHNSYFDCTGLAESKLSNILLIQSCSCFKTFWSFYAAQKKTRHAYPFAAHFCRWNRRRVCITTGITTGKMGRDNTSWWLCYGCETSAKH